MIAADRGATLRVPSGAAFAAVVPASLRRAPRPVDGNLPRPASAGASHFHGRTACRSIARALRSAPSSQIDTHERLPPPVSIACTISCFRPTCRGGRWRRAGMWSSASSCVLASRACLSRSGNAGGPMPTAAPPCANSRPLRTRRPSPSSCVAPRSRSRRARRSPRMTGTAWVDWLAAQMSRSHARCRARAAHRRRLWPAGRGSRGSPRCATSPRAGSRITDRRWIIDWPERAD